MNLLQNMPLLLAVIFLSTVIVALFVAMERVSVSVERDQQLTRMLREPQSGVWVKCGLHGDMPITIAEYIRQTERGCCRCPVCHEIPIRIWLSDETVD